MTPARRNRLRHMAHNGLFVALVVVLAAALAGFQCFGGPMIGFPPNALWLWPLVAAVLAYAGRMRADATT